MTTAVAAPIKWKEGDKVFAVMPSYSERRIYTLDAVQIMEVDPHNRLYRVVPVGPMTEQPVDGDYHENIEWFDHYSPTIREAIANEAQDVVARFMELAKQGTRTPKQERIEQDTMLSQRLAELGKMAEGYSK